MSYDDPDELGTAKCDYECAGDKTQTCGGWKSMSVYQYSAHPAEFVGCWTDSVSDRMMDAMMVDSSMTNKVRGRYCACCVRLEMNTPREHVLTITTWFCCCSAFAIV